MQTKGESKADSEILKVFSDLGLETESERERFRAMAKTEGQNIWGKKRLAPERTRNNTAS